MLSISLSRIWVSSVIYNELNQVLYVSYLMSQYWAHWVIDQ